MIKKTLNSKELSLLYYLINNSFDDKALDNLNLKEEDITYLLDENLIEEVVEQGKFNITKKGLHAIKNKHHISYSIGQPYEDVFETISNGAAIKIAYVLKETSFFKKITPRQVRNIILETIINSNYLQRIDDQTLTNRVLYQTIMYNNITLPFNISVHLYETAKQNIKTLIENKAKELLNYNNYLVAISDGKVVYLEDYDVEGLIKVYNSIKLLSPDGGIVLNSRFK
jgi:hypothetical protein